MAVVEIERDGGIMVIRMNRPERMNALGSELRAALADAWCEFRDSATLEVAIFTSTGRAFCAGEDMKESVERGTAGSGSAPGARKDNPYDQGTLDKPVIVAVQQGAKRSFVNIEADPMSQPMLISFDRRPGMELRLMSLGLKIFAGHLLVIPKRRIQIKVITQIRACK